MKISDSKGFPGAKVCVLCGGDLITYLRDDFGHIPDPNRWDFPGGECEPGETALDCAIRETEEEFGIVLPRSAVVYEATYNCSLPDRAEVAFFVARVDAALISRIVFGREGQRWQMMPVAEFLALEQAVTALQAALAVYLKSDAAHAIKA